MGERTGNVRVWTSYFITRAVSAEGHIPHKDSNTKYGGLFLLSKRRAESSGDRKDSSFSKVFDP